MRRDYPGQIAALDDAGLLALYRQVREDAVDPSAWEPGKAFEHVILQGFAREGARVVWPYSVFLNAENVEQIDGVVYCEGVPPCLIEAKDHAGNVNIEPIAKLRNQLLRRPASSMGICFSRSGFTEAAKTLAAFAMPQTILLWSGAELEYALEHRGMGEGLRAKYRHAIEHGLPDYDLTAAEVIQ